MITNHAVGKLNSQLLGSPCSVGMWIPIAPKRSLLTTGQINWDHAQRSETIHQLEAESKHHLGSTKIRPHRFGGEGVLIGGQTATLNA